MLEPTRLSQDLLRALFDHGVRFVHWKSNSHLMEALAGETDLDLLVHPDDGDRFILSAKSAGFLRIQSQPWASYPDVEDWLGMDEETTKFLHLHVHYRLVTGLKRVKHLCLPWHEQMLEGAVVHPSGWPIPAPSFEALVLLIRIWAKMPPVERLKSAPKIPESILIELRWLLSQSTFDEVLDATKSVGLDMDGASAKIRAIIEGDATSVAGLAKSIYRQTKKHYRVGWCMALSLAIIRYLEQLRRCLMTKLVSPVVLRKTLCGGGAMIALVGSDGAGKSTLSRDLNKWLRYKLDCHEVYLGSGDGNTGFVNRARKLIGRARRKQRGVSDPAMSKAVKRGLAKRVYRLFDLLLMQRKVRQLRGARVLADQGSIMLLDRYPQSQFAGINDGPKLQNSESFAWAGRSEAALYSEVAEIGPDLVLKLIVSPEVALKRKPDHNMSEISSKCEIVQRLDFGERECVAIDADQHYDRVLFEAKSSSWCFLRKEID